MAHLAPVEVSVLSTEYLTVPFTADVDPLTLDSVHFSFTTGHNVAPTTWTLGEIVGSEARILIGPGGAVTTLTVNDYLVWVKITDTPEVIIETPGFIRVF